MEKMHSTSAWMRLIALLGIAVFVFTCMLGCSGGVPADDASRTKYEGISFVLPDGWSSSETSGKLTITPEEKSGSDASFGGLHFGFDIEETGNEAEVLDSSLKSVLKNLAGSSYDVSDATITTNTIDGVATETAKASVTIPVSGTSVKVSTNLVAFGAVDGAGFTFLLFQARGDDYNADIDGIIKSVRIVRE